MVASDRPNFPKFIIEHQGYSHSSEFLKLDGSNANINIDIGSYDLTTTGTLSGGTLTDGTATLSGGIVTGLTTPLTFGQGGTGLATWTQYLIPYADTTTSMGQIAIGDATQVLTSNGAGAAPTFQAAVGGSVSFGTDNQIPYTNAGADDFDYSSILTFDGTDLKLKADSSKLYFGAGDDVSMRWDGNSFETDVIGTQCNWDVDGMLFSMRSNGRFYGQANGYLGFATNGDMLLNPTNDLLIQTDAYLRGDSRKLYFGAGDDYSIEWDGSDAVHTISAGDFVFTGGNVGIGTASPASILELKESVVNGDGALLRIINDGSGAGTGQTASIKLGRSFNERNWKIVSSSTANYGVQPDLIFSTNKATTGDTVTEVMRLQNNGDLKLVQDSAKLYFGAGDDSSITDTGSLMTIDPDANSVGSRYLLINGQALMADKLLFTQTDGNEYIDSLADGYMDYRATTAHRFGDGTNQTVIEADGTVEFNGTATVWKDINMGAAQLSRPSSSQPDLVNFVDEAAGDTGIQTYAFAVGEKVHGSFEMQHDYKEGSDFTFHIHWQGITAPSGTDNVQWRLTYTFGTDDATLDAVTTIDSADTPFDTQYEFKRTDVVVISGTNRTIGQQMLFTLERVASTGDAYAGDALIATTGIHYEVDTVGSRQIIIK